MSIIRARGSHVFETGCEMIDVTSPHRPDTTWRYIDPSGHEHRWFVDGKPATDYSPILHYETPRLVWVKDGEEYWEDDDEPHDVGHLECRECGAHVEPGYTADMFQQMMPGRRWFKIDGVLVTPEEFGAQIETATAERAKLGTDDTITTLVVKCSRCGRERVEAFNPASRVFPALCNKCLIAVANMGAGDSGGTGSSL